jgi:sugar lactone lactonase YvrE
MVNPGVANTFGLTLNGDVANIVLSLANSSPVEGTSSTISLAVNAYDADDNLIIGPGTYDNGPVVLSDSDSSGATSLSAMSIAGPAANVTVSYNGAAVSGGSATFSASAGSVVTNSAQDAVLTPTAPSTYIYAPNIYSGSVTAYLSTARGNITPTTTLSGIPRPSGVAFSGGNTYVSTWYPDAIYVYASGQTGASATITGSNTKLFQPQGMVTDGSGNIYVASESNAITAYAPNANGNATPLIDLEGSNTALSDPVDVAMDRRGNLYVANQGNNTVTAYAPSATGNVAPFATISGPDTGLNGPAGITIGPSGDIVVANSFANTITTYSPTANGDAAPISTISGPDTRLSRPQGVAFDASGNLWVADLNSSAIDEYAGSAGGDATPILEISGSNTGLSGPLFMVARLPSMINCYIDDSGYVNGVWVTKLGPQVANNSTFPNGEYITCIYSTPNNDPGTLSYAGGAWQSGGSVPGREDFNDWGAPASENVTLTDTLTGQYSTFVMNWQ